MRNPPSLFSLLFRVWDHLGVRRRWQVIALCGLIFFVSIIELLNIGSIVPFLAVLANPEKTFNNPLVRPALVTFHISSPDQMLISAMVFFVTFIVVTNFIRMMVLWIGTRLSFGIGADLSLKAYKNILDQPYEAHLLRNSSDVISGINKIDAVVTIMNQIFIFINSILISIILLTTIFILNPEFTSIFIFIFSTVYFGIGFLTRTRLLKNSEVASKSASNLVRLMQEGLGGIRDILLDSSQNLYSFHFHRADLLLRRARGNINILSNAPRFIVESVGVLLIVVFVYWMMNGSVGLSDAIPLLGAFALGAQRLLPVLQQGYSAATVIQGEKFPLRDALVLLDNSTVFDFQLRSDININFNQEIQLSHVHFIYPNAVDCTLSDVSLVIKKGEKVGIIGKTGCGKSTLIDIIMGLLLPKSGGLFVDGVGINNGNIKAWQKLIAHVPQSIFLIDASVAKNIALGIFDSEIDMERVIAAAKMAEIDGDIGGWELGYSTLVGERGVRLSGGQRQRIGLARAFYKNPKLLILDEATSALDMNTESKVMQSIDGYSEVSKNKVTVLMIAHRLETLKNCQKIIMLDGGKIVKIGAYDEIVQNKVC